MIWGKILRQFCEQKKVIIEGEMCADHVHMLAAIPPNLSVSSFMGYLKGKSSLMIFDRHAHLIMLRNTPLVLSLLGADKDLTVSTNYRTLNKVLREKHKLPVDVMKQVPKAMTDPIMIFKSATVANDYVMMLDLKDNKGATVVVPVSLNYDGIANYTVNYVPSVYGKANENTGKPNNNWFINQIEQGNLVYQNNKKSREWRTSSGLRLPRVGSDLITHGKNKNILTDVDLSSAKSANPTYYQNSSPRGLIRFNPKTQEAMITVFKDKKKFFHCPA